MKSLRLNQNNRNLKNMKKYPKKGIKRNKIYIELHDSKEPQVEELKKEEMIVRVTSYRHPHNPERQQSSTKGWEHQHTSYGLAWN